jgi:hypothetical protein
MAQNVCDITSWNLAGSTFEQNCGAGLGSNLSQATRVSTRLPDQRELIS